MTQREKASLADLSFQDHDRLHAALARGANRRELIGGLLAGGMVLATACGVVTRASAALAQTPRRGGSVRVALSTGSANDTADPARIGTSSDYVRVCLFYSALTELDSQLAAQPALAESWSHDDAALVWRFKLRSGVHFHDGKALTAADVVYSLNRHKLPAVASRAKAMADAFQEITASGPLEVQIKLAAANLELPILLGLWNFMIVPEGTTDYSKPVGTGPFKFQEFTPGVRTVGVRNDEYWRSGAPYLDRVEVISILDENARLNALLAGDVQIIMAVNPRMGTTLRGNPAIELFETKSGTYHNIIFPQNVTPTNNPDFVMGIKQLLNRPQMISSIYRQYAVLGNDHPIAPTYKYYSPEIPQRAFDPDQAKFHLNKAGVLGSSIPIVASDGIGRSVDFAVILQQAAADIGLTINIQRVPSTGYYANVWMKTPHMHFNILTQRPTADVMLTLLYQSNAAWNEAGWNNPKFDQLLVAARSEMDEPKRRQMYTDMETIIRDEGDTAIPLFYSLLDAHSNRVKGLQPIPIGNIMGYNFAPYIWLDS